MHGRVAVYFEAAAVITTLVLLGQVLELRARARTGNAIRALLGLAPRIARAVLRRRLREDVPLEQVSRATACACGPARRSRWTASCWRARAVDESMVTGEPIPVEKTAGSRVTGRHGQRRPAAS